MISMPGVTLPQGVITDNGVGKAEMDRVQDTVGNERLALRHEFIDQPVQGGHVGVLFRYQDGDCSGFFRYPGAALMQAQQVIRARPGSAQQLFILQGIDADLVTRVMQGLDRLFQVRERRIRQAADVDYISAVTVIPCRTGKDFVHADLRGFHYLGKNAHAVVVQAGRCCLPAEKNGQVLDVHGAPLHRYAQRLAQRLQVTLAQSRDDDPVHTVNLMQPAPDHLCRHQRGDTDADLSCLPGKLGRLHVPKDAPQALLRKLAGEKENVLGHGLYSIS